MSSPPSRISRPWAEQVIRHWTEGYGAWYNRDRKEAMEGVEVVPSLEAAEEAVRGREGESPRLITTDAAPKDGKALSFPEAGVMLAGGRPVLLLLGTAWGLHRDVLRRADSVLEPVRGVNGYNHLSVRAAAAVILDRLIIAAGRGPEVGL